VTYNYYEQLNAMQAFEIIGYRISFLSRRYTSAIEEVLDESKKTIAFIYLA
jgi:hypothetical protein